MAGKLTPQEAEVVRNARSLVSQALGLLQQLNYRSSVLGEDGVTFESALLDAIFEIDSQPDIVDPYLDPQIGLTEAQAGVGKAYSIGSLQVSRRQGKLQQLRSLKTALFGGTVLVVDEEGARRTDTVEGLLDRLKYVSVAGKEEDA